MICLRNKLGKRFGPDIFLRVIGDFMGVVSPIDMAESTKNHPQNAKKDSGTYSGAS